MMKLIALLHSKYPQMFFRFIPIAIAVFCFGSGIIAGIYVIFLQWDTTSVSACNYSGTPLINIIFCFLGSFLGSGLWFGFFALALLMVTAMFLFPVGFVIGILLEIYDYFFEEDPQQDLTGIVAKILLVMLFVGFLYLIFSMDDELSFERILRLFRDK